MHIHISQAKSQMLHTLEIHFPIRLTTKECILLQKVQSSVTCVLPVHEVLSTKREKKAQKQLVNRKWSEKVKDAHLHTL